MREPCFTKTENHLLKQARGGGSANNQRRALSCSGGVEVKVLYGHRSVRRAWDEHYAGHKLTRQMPTKKKKKKKKCRDTQRENINCVFLAFIKVCQGEEGEKKRKTRLWLSHSPQRCICKCHACQIASNCVSQRCHIFPWNRENQREQSDNFYLLVACVGKKKSRNLELHYTFFLNCKRGLLYHATLPRTDERRCYENLSATLELTGSILCHLSSTPRCVTH